MVNEFPNRLTINIADWPLTLELPAGDDRTQRKILDHYSAFIVPVQTNAVTVRIQVVPGPTFVPFVEGGSWQIHTLEQNGRIEFQSHLEVGWADRRLGQGELTMRPNGNPENFLRVLYAWKCLEQDALLLHACGVIRNGSGYGFFGPSGSGKSTIAGLSLEHQVLSDDMVIIKRGGAGFQICGVPFRGELLQAPRTNGKSDLRGLYTLVKDEEHRTLPLSRTKAVAQLSACVPFVMAQPANARKVMDICSELSNSVPIQALHFKPEKGFWSVINGAE